MKKRILVLATVAALMALMLVVMAPTAFAARDRAGCRVTDSYDAISVTPGLGADRNGDGIVCRHFPNNKQSLVQDNNLNP
jgi:hypothetical protein